MLVHWFSLSLLPSPTHQLHYFRNCFNWRKAAVSDFVFPFSFVLIQINVQCCLPKARKQRKRRYVTVSAGRLFFLTPIIAVRLVASRCGLPSSLSPAFSIVLFLLSVHTNMCTICLHYLPISSRVCCIYKYNTVTTTLKKKKTTGLLLELRDITKITNLN